MSPEHTRLPDWAADERQADLGWIQAHADLFWAAAQIGHQADGRGALFVDTTVQLAEWGHPFGYIPQDLVEEFQDADINRLVRDYDPAAEFVVVLLKTDDRASSYRLRLRPPGCRPNSKMR
ncbi:MAG: hypothetical protein KC441_10305 [Anaerolineales bacterium]|nr:hypothetical protein [Anaerolineales bacterium]